MENKKSEVCIHRNRVANIFYSKIDSSRYDTISKSTKSVVCRPGTQQGGKHGNMHSCGNNELMRLVEPCYRSSLCPAKPSRATTVKRRLRQPTVPFKNSTHQQPTHV